MLAACAPKRAQACVGCSGSRVQRLGELVEQQAAWRERKARPEIEDLVGRIRKVSCLWEGAGCLASCLLSCWKHPPLLRPP